MRWGRDWRSVNDLFYDYMKLEPEAPGKQELVSYLSDRYDGSIEAFNQGWELDLGSFVEILVMRMIPSSTSAAWKDRRVFTGHVADQFFSVTCTAVGRLIRTT